MNTVSQNIRVQILLKTIYFWLKTNKKEFRPQIFKIALNNILYTRRFSIPYFNTYLIIKQEISSMIPCYYNVNFFKNYLYSCFSSIFNNKINQINGRKITLDGYKMNELCENSLRESLFLLDYYFISFIYLL